MRVLGTPFDGGFPPQALTYVTGAAAIAAALVFLLWRRHGLPREHWLLLAVALTPVMAIAGVTVAAKVLHKTTYYSLITRYTAVAAPFMLVAIAVTLVRAPRLAALGLATLVAIAVISGLSATYSSANNQPNLRSAVAQIAQGYRKGDTVRMPPGRLTIPTSGVRAWVVSDTGSEPFVTAALAQAGLHAVSNTVLNPDIELTLARH